MTTERKKVLWFGTSPRAPMRTELKRRGLVEQFYKKGDPSPTDYAVSCAAVFSFDEKRKSEFIGALKTCASVAIDHGLLVVLAADDEDQLKIMQGHLGDLPTGSFVYRINGATHEIPEIVARHPAEPAAELGLDIKGVNPSADHRLLLQRAFSGCSTITLKELKAGLSGANVYVVYAEMPDGDADPFPLPYFAKIGSRDQIAKERGNYDRFVARYIPFSQRPNCELRRCISTSKLGILVGDFVEHSVPLSAVIRDTGGRAVIHSLFDDGLRGWRQQASRPGSEILFSIFRPKVFDPTRSKNAHVQSAKQFGATKAPAELAEMLDKLASHKYKSGPIHGDLHAENIRVRNDEAILIDFYKADVGPLVADLASLEIAVTFWMEADTKWDSTKDGPYVDSQRFHAWRELVDKLFRKGQFAIVSPLRDEPSDFWWVWNVCRQLRLMAHSIDIDNDSYGYVLAAYMLALARFPNDESQIEPGTPDSVIRAYAYWAAERILRELGPGGG